ncbi:MAG: serine/threonine-protein kinase, partial [Gemmataceae bacterium]
MKPDGPATTLAIPERLGRYRVTGKIADGSFATIYKGLDEELGRVVAIKLLQAQHSERVRQAFQEEAKILARLEHPSIVPIYDIGTSNEGTFFLVTKFVEGGDLRRRLKEGRVPLEQAVTYVASMARALHFAHEQGLVHRDVKPGNILLENGKRALLVDFGLALQERDFGTGPANVGTPLFMSPEQARREGHRVDGRSDIYSLGIVFYQLLTGQHPFHGESLDELLEFICNQEPLSPRQLDPTIPEEVERVWRKMTRKRASERYARAHEVGDDLEQWQARERARAQRGDADVRMVPRGLRSFERADADFFLKLVPGPRDRDGVPESLSFWLDRLESRAPEVAFTVGVLYGPSGCGKSSLVQAGLLPRLADHVVPIVIDATGQPAEDKLLLALRRHCPGLPAHIDLVECLCRIRNGEGLPANSKLLMVIDQFEQFLLARHQPGAQSFIDALRQCDGVRVQVLLLVRDDFWLGLSRFLRDLEVPLAEGENMALVDLFDPQHARLVLGEMGRAYGKLPDNLAECSPAQQQFLERAVATVAEEGKVFPVRLALFAEVMKNRAWTPDQLDHIGPGLGSIFIEQTFAGPAAPPAHRLHQRAASAVLRTLLPDEESASTKGQIRTQQELLDVSGYRYNSTAFAELMKILDQELRLVTPIADLDGNDETTCYRLTHDYLVPALRHWLNARRRQSHRGRVLLRLADRTAEWNLHPVRRHLPTLWEWLDVHLFTRRRDWTAPQQAMLRAANRFYGIRIGVFLVFLGLAGLLGLNLYRRIDVERNELRAGQIVEKVRSFHRSQLAGFAKEIEPYRPWVEPMLKQLIADPATPEDDRLHARLVLLGFDDEQVMPLTEYLLRADPDAVLEIRSALEPYRARVVPQLWRWADDTQRTPAERVRAACALAGLDSENPRWQRTAFHVVKDLFAENAFVIGEWLDALLPVRNALVPPFLARFHDEGHMAQQIVTCDALIAYAGQRPGFLEYLLLESNDLQLRRLWPAVEQHGEAASAFFEKVLNDSSRDGRPGEPAEFRQRARRQARAALALFLLQRPDSFWTLLRQREDPTLRTYLVHSVAGLPPESFLSRWPIETDPTARRALLFCLGSFEPDSIAPPRREEFVRMLTKAY